MGTGDSGEVTVRPELGRSQALSLVSVALMTIIPDLTVELQYNRYILDKTDTLGFQLGIPLPIAPIPTVSTSGSHRHPPGSRRSPCRSCRRP